MKRLSPFSWDVLFAALLTVATQVELVLAADRIEGSLVVQHVMFTLATACVAYRRRAPLAATLGVSVAMTVQTLEGEAPVVGGFLAMLILLASLGYYASWRHGIVGVCALAAAVVSYDFLVAEFVFADFLGNLVIVLMTWGLAKAARISTDRRVAVEIARDRFAREEVAAERGRIARDLHDSVAHGLTLMTLQAGAARERRSERLMADALQSIEDGGRAAIADMHRFLQLTGDAGADPGAAPGIHHVEEMVERVRGSGLEVQLRLGSGVDRIAGGVSSTAYRIVQEALTNAVKHSGAGRVDVSIGVDGGALVIDIVDDGAERGGGRGCLGIGPGH